MNRFQAAAALVAMLAAGLFAPITLAETAAEEGQRLFREHCRHCHDDGSANGKYTPMTLIQAQWERWVVYRSISATTNPGAVRPWARCSTTSLTG